jgi:hypothetical protein
MLRVPLGLIDIRVFKERWPEHSRLFKRKKEKKEKKKEVLIFYKSPQLHSYPLLFFFPSTNVDL